MKRLLDILFSCVGLMMTWPVFAVVAVGVKLSSPGPVFFRQTRMGLFGRSFTIYKFRTMEVQAARTGPGVTTRGDTRVTRFGRLLRRSKLDELPQMWNVLRGDMSFVGPRPEIPEFAELYPRRFDRILRVRPGITHRTTLNFRREEEILAGANDPRRFYIDKVLPVKISGYEESLEQSLAEDIQTLVETIVPFLGAKPYGPEHFAPKAAAPVAAVPAAAGIPRRFSLPPAARLAYRQAAKAPSATVPAHRLGGPARPPEKGEHLIGV